MKSFKLFPILALGAVSFFAGCGDDGSSSAPEEAGLASGGFFAAVDAKRRCVGEVCRVFSAG